MSGYAEQDDFYDYGHEPSIKRFPVRLKTVKFIHPFSDPENIEKYLTQTKVWTDADGTDHPIKSLEKDYLFNILAWLDANWNRIYFTRHLIPDLNGDSLIDDVEVENTPLIKKLRARYKKLITA